MVEDMPVAVTTGVMTLSEFRRLTPYVAAKVEDYVGSMAVKHDAAWFTKHRENIRVVLQDFIGAVSGANTASQQQEGQLADDNDQDTRE